MPTYGHILQALPDYLPFTTAHFILAALTEDEAFAACGLGPVYTLRHRRLLPFLSLPVPATRLPSYCYLYRLLPYTEFPTAAPGGRAACRWSARRPRGMGSARTFLIIYPLPGRCRPSTHGAFALILLLPSHTGTAALLYLTPRGDAVL